MKNIKFTFALLITLAIVLTGCKKDPVETNKTYDTNKAYTEKNVKFGDNGKQKMDIYLPKDRNAASTKVFVLIHGGGWNAGDKSDMQGSFDNLKDLYPDNAIININYRLGTPQSPGYTKQIDDIKLAIEEIKDEKYDVSNQFCLVGVSAGGHLSLLYAYAFDPNHEVKAIVNTVGPTDLTDPSYLDDSDPLMQYMFASLLGLDTYSSNPQLFKDASPAYQVTASAPPTISFYGNQDPLIPTSQMDLLHDKLDDAGVYNEKTMYDGAGHANWNQAQAVDYVVKIYDFLALTFQ